MVPLPVVPASTQAPYPAVQIANTFVERYSGADGLSHMKVQKLVFYTYGWWLALMNGAPPVATSKPQVWKLGPVFQPIYGEFSKFKNGAITGMQPLGPFSGPASIAREKTPGSQMVDWIWNRYGHFSAFELSDMTHQAGTPWYNVALKHKFEVPRFTEMEDDEIRPYFTNLAQKEGII